MITPNRLTYLRIVIALIAPFILLFNRTVSGDVLVMFLFSVAGATDWFDGYLARKYSLMTGTGKILDPIADKLLILGLMLVFVQVGLYSFAWVFFILIREISVTTVRLIRLRTGKVIPAEWAGKVKMGFQISSVSMSLILITFLDVYAYSRIPDFYLFLNFFNHLFLILANIVTIVSGYLFFKRLS